MGRTCAGVRGRSVGEPTVGGSKDLRGERLDDFSWLKVFDTSDGDTVALGVGRDILYNFGATFPSRPDVASTGGG